LHKRKTLAGLSVQAAETARTLRRTVQYLTSDHLDAPGIATTTLAQCYQRRALHDELCTALSAHRLVWPHDIPWFLRTAD
jgi:hypothetical protein